MGENNPYKIIPPFPLFSLAYIYIYRLIPIFLAISLFTDNQFLVKLCRNRTFHRTPHSVLITRKDFMAQDDNIIRWAMFAIIAFGITGILCEIVLSWKRGGMLWHLTDFFIVLVLASIVGGGVFWACKKLNI